jgi:hypothetical protein
VPDGGTNYHQSGGVWFGIKPGPTLIGVRAGACAPNKIVGDCDGCILRAGSGVHLPRTPISATHMICLHPKTSKTPVFEAFSFVGMNNSPGTEAPDSGCRCY